MSEGVYIFQDREAEQRRLEAQARLFDPLTARLFAAAGIGPGMRVLDLGSGAGHVAQLVARLVGHDGAVVGVERDAQAVESARLRLADAGVDNVELHVGDVQAVEQLEDRFDAVVGRLILMYLPDPAAALSGAARLLRPGGVIAMHEGDMTYTWATPGGELWDQVRGWFLQTLEIAGVEARMGLRLYDTFVAAGLPGPELVLEAAAIGGPEAPAFGWANVVRGVLPLMERLGVAKGADLQPDTLEDRLFEEISARNGIVIGPPMMGAWTRVP